VCEREREREREREEREGVARKREGQKQRWRLTTKMQICCSKGLEAYQVKNAGAKTYSTSMWT
jgi:hypothetical protein